MIIPDLEEPLRCSTQTIIERVSLVIYFTADSVHILWCKWNFYRDIWRNIEHDWNCRVHSVVSRPRHAIFNIKHCSARSPHRTAQLRINTLTELHTYKLNSHIHIRPVNRRICSRNVVLQFSWLLSKIRWKLRSVFGGVNVYA